MKRTLSVAVVSLLLSLPAGAATIVQNGSFEDLSGGVVTFDGGNWQVYSTIPGWKKVTDTGKGIEVQSNATLGSIDAHSGDKYVELDSHPGPGSNSTMQQDVTLSVGRYLLSFFYSPRTSSTGDNTINFAVTNDATSLVSGSVSGPNATYKVGFWTQVDAFFNVTKAGTYALTFAAAGTENTLGGFIDDVSITPAPVPVPAAGLLLLGGLGGLAALKRRRRA